MTASKNGGGFFNTPGSSLRGLTSLFSTPATALRVPVKSTPATATFAGASAAAALHQVQATPQQQQQQQQMPPVSSTPASIPTGSTAAQATSGTQQMKTKVQLPNDVPKRLSFRSPYIAKPGGGGMVGVSGDDKEVVIRKLEKEVVQLREELESVVEEAAECESEYVRIKQEGSLLCSKYDEVCQKLREASAEYNHLCDIFDAQVFSLLFALFVFSFLFALFVCTFVCSFVCFLVCGGGYMMGWLDPDTFNHCVRLDREGEGP